MHRFAITTSANVSKANAKRTLLRVGPGVVDKIDVAYPPGPQGLLHVAIYREGALLWPVNDDDGFAWDDFTLTWNPLYRLDDEPLAFQAFTWNEDDTFAHQVVIRMNIVPLETYFRDREELGILQRLERSLFGRGRGN